MKSLIVFTFMLSFVIGFNGCTVTNHYKLNSNLEFEYVPKNERKTYELFAKDQFAKEIKEESSVGSFDDEFEIKSEEIDPLEGYNRVMTSFNDFLYINVLNPVASGYKEIVPQEGRVAISNFFQNLTYPVRLVNNLLQFKFTNASEESGRFLINSTVGILGFMDPASKEYNLNEHDEDFGQTLGYYGFDGGFHIVLPVYGPSNVRDVVGLSVDSYISPLSDAGYDELEYKIPDRFEKTLGLKSIEVINSTSLNLGKYENLKKDAIDLYPFLKDIYTQNRNKMIKE
ncbi:VacJ family lipoprotein [Campylobacterota bacterium DY0563]